MKKQSAKVIGLLIVTIGILTAFLRGEPAWYPLMVVGLFLVLRALNQKDFKQHMTNRVLLQYAIYVFGGLLVEGFRLLTQSWEYVGVYGEIYFLAPTLLIAYPVMFLYLKESVDYLTKYFSLAMAMVLTTAITFMWGEVLNSVAPLWIPSATWKPYIMVVLVLGSFFETYVAVKAVQE
jgi:hypothetical protein